MLWDQIPKKPRNFQNSKIPHNSSKGLPNLSKNLTKLFKMEGEKKSAK